MIQRFSTGKSILLLMAIALLVLSFNTSLFGQQRQNLDDPNQLNTPLKKIELLSLRLKQAFTPSTSSRAVDYRGDRNLRHPVQDRAHHANNYPTANRIGVNSPHSRNIQAAFVQQSRLAQQPQVDSQKSNRQAANRNRQGVVPAAGNATGAFGQSEQRGGADGPSSRTNPPPSAFQQNQNSFPTANQSSNNGIDSFDETRFKHFSNREPASVRAIRLEDQLQQVQLKNRSLIAENESLTRNLLQNEQLLHEIQTAIDDAIQQLSSAQSANHGLREQIAQLEFEKIEQEKKSSKLFDDIRGQLNELLVSEISDGG